MSRSVSAPSSVTNTSPCWNGLIVPGSTFRYGSDFCAETDRPPALGSRPSEAATMPFPSAETTPPVTNTYLATGSHRSRRPGRSRRGRALAFGERGDELRAAGHPLELLSADEVVQLLDARVRGVSRDLLDAEVRVGDARDLWEVRDREHLRPLAEALKRGCDRMSRDAADACVDLVEHERLAARDRGERQGDARELPTRGGVCDRREGESGVRSHEERHLVRAARADLALAQLDDELALPHPQRAQLRGDRASEGRRGDAASAREVLGERRHAGLRVCDRARGSFRRIAASRLAELALGGAGEAEKLVVGRGREAPLQIRDRLQPLLDVLERAGLGVERRHEPVEIGSDL